MILMNVVTQHSLNVVNVVVTPDSLIIIILCTVPCFHVTVWAYSHTHIMLSGGPMYYEIVLV